MQIDAADPATWTDADLTVAAWVVEALSGWQGYLDNHPSLSIEHAPSQRQQSDHLRQCGSLRVTSFEGSDGVYGCETGCDYWRVEGRVVCDHYPDGAEFSVGDFGELEYWLEDLASA